MTERSSETATPRGPASRTDVDIATGVLVGRLGTTVNEALDQLFSTARDNRVSLFELSRTVTTLAEGGDGRDSFTRRVAREQWGSALGGASVPENSVSA